MIELIVVVSQKYENIVNLQEADRRLQKLANEAKSNPLVDALEQIVSQTDHMSMLLQSVQQKKSEALKEQRLLENQTQDLQQKQKTCDAKLYGGSVTSTKELLSLQNEVEFLKTSISELDDKQLVVLESLDALEDDEAKLARDVGEFEAKKEIAKSDLQEFREQLAQQVSDVEAQRKEFLDQVDSSLLASYEKLYEMCEGVVFVEVVGSACGGCHMHLSARNIDAVTSAAEGVEVPCDACGRLLIR